MRTGLRNSACAAWRRDGVSGKEQDCGYFPNKRSVCGSCREQILFSEMQYETDMLQKWKFQLEKGKGKKKNHNKLPTTHKTLL